jgi:hypothetical protein
LHHAAHARCIARRRLTPPVTNRIFAAP